VPSYNSKHTIAECLTALERQVTTASYEIILVDSSNDGVADLVAQRFPAVTVYGSKERLFPGDALNLGISQAAGDILAFTGADCVAAPNWIEEIVKAHQAPHPVIGGVVAHGNPESYVAWANYFCEFTQWMPQTPDGPMVEIPTGCLSVKRWAFDRYGPFLEGTFCSDTAFNWKLVEGGQWPIFRNSLRVAHLSLYTGSGLLRKKLFHGRTFARVRVAEQRFSTLKRAAFALGAPVLPLLLLARVSLRLLKNRGYLGPFMVASPLVFLGLTAWSVGEFLGYVSGPVDRNE
jgi:glycosyltransferase involved in cell wall biosynthesis